MITMSTYNYLGNGSRAVSRLDMTVSFSSSSYDVTTLCTWIFIGRDSNCSQNSVTAALGSKQHVIEVSWCTQELFGLSPKFLDCRHVQGQLVEKWVSFTPRVEARKQVQTLPWACAYGVLFHNKFGVQYSDLLLSVFSFTAPLSAGLSETVTGTCEAQDVFFLLEELDFFGTDKWYRAGRVGFLDP